MGPRTRAFAGFVGLAIVCIPLAFLFENLLFARRFGEGEDFGVLVVLFACAIPVCGVYHLTGWLMERLARARRSRPTHPEAASIEPESPGST